MSRSAPTKVRCAIYTRKSSEEGLEQEFNSLHAQREACAAYVASQASEGWSLLPDCYDDGGLSGGTLERPALQRLLADVESGAIDIIVLYKVDRLTRSLLDFARLVETFDRSGVSFVSVTQSFNTTTSMGRLTLNMLLSFAQFEREVTAERIRDKIAASKAKGMWMGGTPPIGYAPEGRSLVIVEEHAPIVRTIYGRYLACGNVREVAEELERERIRSPHRTTRSGHVYGGRVLSRGQIYQILKNPIYVGEIAHKGTVYPGNHEAIIDRDTWDKVQQQLADNRQGVRKRREANASLLAGLLFDTEDQPLIAVHTTKGARRYRYYVSKAAHHGETDEHAPTLRIPAPDIERLVRDELSQLLDDPVSVLGMCGASITPGNLAMLRRTGSDAAPMLDRASVRRLVERITVHPDHIALALSRPGLARAIGVDAQALGAVSLALVAKASIQRSGHRLKLVRENGAAVDRRPDPTLLGLLVKARRWWATLSEGALDITSLAREENVTASYITRVVRMAFLSPQVVDAILEGKARTDLDGSALLATGAVPPHWQQQSDRYLAR